jgi:hypothetical protein
VATSIAVSSLLLLVDQVRLGQYSAWTTFKWNINGGTPVDISIIPCTGQSIGFPNSEEGTCEGCDNVQLYSHDCDEYICVTRHYPAVLGAGTLMKFYIEPPLGPCNEGTICEDDPNNPHLTGPAIDHTDFPNFDLTNVGTVTSPNGHSATEIDVFPNTSGIELGACEGVCFHIPRCSPPVSHEVYVVTPGDPAPCSPGAIGLFKISEPKAKMFKVPNYPNPLTEANHFNTMIPFELATNGGGAKISLFNESGKEVFDETQSFVGSGKHFFYFTGKQLPAGKYFYAIESPLGVVIVKQSLLIVK